MTTISAPSLVRLEDVPRRQETADGGFTVAVAIDASSHGSNVLLGFQWVQPGTDPVRWAADAITHEVYYLVSGALRLTWAGPVAGGQELVAGDAFFLPPGHDYEVICLGSKPAFVVWAMSPARG